MIESSFKHEQLHQTKHSDLRSRWTRFAGTALAFIVPLSCHNKDLRTRGTGTAITRPIEDRLLFPLKSPPAATITRFVFCSSFSLWSGQKICKVI